MPFGRPTGLLDEIMTEGCRFTADVMGVLEITHEGSIVSQSIEDGVYRPIGMIK